MRVDKTHHDVKTEAIDLDKFPVTDKLCEDASLLIMSKVFIRSISSELCPGLKPYGASVATVGIGPFIFVEGSNCQTVFSSEMLVRKSWNVSRVLGPAFLAFQC